MGLVWCCNLGFFFSFFLPENPLNGCMPTPGHTWALCGRSHFIPSSSSGMCKHAAHLQRQHVHAAQMFPTTRLEKVLKLNKSCFFFFLWHLCKRSKAGWLYRSALHFPFRDIRLLLRLFPMRSRCRSDLSGLNSFIMRAAHLEGPPTHMRPRRATDTQNTSMLVCIYGSITFNPHEDSERDECFYASLNFTFPNLMPWAQSPCLFGFSGEFLHSLACKSLLKPECSDGVERHTFVSQIIHVQQLLRKITF